MAVDPSRVIELLGNSHLFRNLDPAQLDILARQFVPVAFKKDDVLYHEGEGADSFYLIYEGQVQLSTQRKKETKYFAALVAGDYFGEDGYFSRRSRSTAVTTVTDCTLLRMDYRRFAELIRKIPDLKANLQVSIDSRRMARTKHWSWLNPDEIVYVLVRKHTYFLFLNLVLPLLALLVGIALSIYLNFIFTYTQGTPLGFWLGVACVIVPFLWVGWNAFDWSNDYYIVTNLRVIWLEVIAGLYESRQEAPLNAILSVSIDRDQVGRAFDFGTVNVRTYTIPIPLKNVVHPEQIAAIIEEHWRRSNSITQKEDATAMEEAIREKLGLPVNREEAVAPMTDESVEPVSNPQQGFFQLLFGNVFKVRFDVGQTVTYRKHWFVLVEAIWIQVVLLAAVAVLLVGRISNVYTFLPTGEVILIGFVVALILLLWLLYDYIDWHNDIYQVTPDQIVDIERKPLGTEDKKTAPLENILSIEYKRLGFLGLLFNFGTVFIKIGSTTFNFDYVFDPSQVQQDIFRRKLEREASHKKAEREAERDRLSSWIATYHQTYGSNSHQTPIPPATQEPENDPNQENEGKAEELDDPDGEDKNGLGWIG